MTPFRTIFPISKFEPFGYNDRMMLCGSCFVENIGKKLKNACFNVSINPFGILFNPCSLAESMKDIIDNKKFTESELIFHNDIYHSFSHHSLFSHPDKTICIEQINQSTREAHIFLKKSKYLIITLGTAWIYRHRASGKIVSSCHKIPQKEFDKELLSIDKIVETLSVMIQRLSKFHPDIRIVLTISPVRHIKDGFVENQQSKASLILAAKQLTEGFSICSYFPVYEIFMDDLRDYRFYASDMLHPSETAVQYVWERFGETFFDKGTQHIINEVESIFTAGQHRPFHAASDEYLKFRQLQLEKARKLALRFPEADFMQLEALFK